MKMSSATGYRVPAVVEWDDFLDAVRSNGGRGFSYGADSPTAASAPRTCSWLGCECGGTYNPSRRDIPSRYDDAPLPASTPRTTPTPAPTTTTTTTTATTVAAPATATASAPSVTPAVVTAADIPRVLPEKLLYEVVVEKYYGLRRTPSALFAGSYDEYKRWETRQSAEYRRSTTPYQRMTRFITVDRAYYLEEEFDKIQLLGKVFAGRSLMEIKDIIFPLYQEWLKTAIFAPKTNRWQKMKQFAAECAGLL